LHKYSRIFGKVYNGHYTIVRLYLYRFIPIAIANFTKSVAKL